MPLGFSSVSTGGLVGPQLLRSGALAAIGRV